MLEWQVRDNDNGRGQGWKGGGDGGAGTGAWGKENVEKKSENTPLKALWYMVNQGRQTMTILVPAVYG